MCSCLCGSHDNFACYNHENGGQTTDRTAGDPLLQDGDQYMVLWDQELLQPGNSEPMDYTAEPPDKVRLGLATHSKLHCSVVKCCMVQQANTAGLVSCSGRRLQQVVMELSPVPLQPSAQPLQS